VRAVARHASSNRCERDGGFTLLEVILAMAIVIGVMLAMVGLMVGGLKTIEQARQRQTANSLATQQLERLRALPYDTVTKPVPSKPLGAGIQYVVNVGGVNRFQPTALVPGLDEPLVVNDYSGQVTTQKVGQVTYTIQTYVSVPASTGQQAYDLAAIVSWKSSVNTKGKYIIQRSTTYSPAACLSTLTSPFSSACQNYYTAQAGQSLSGVTITDPVDSSQNIAGLDARSLQLAFSGVSTNLLVEQTVSGTTSATTTGATRTAATTQSVDGLGATANFDSDPSSPPNQIFSNLTPSQIVGAKVSATNVTGSAGKLSVSPSDGDQGQAVGAVGADSGNCTDAGGSPLTTGPQLQLRPCASAWIRSQGSAANVSYTTPTGGVATLATFGAASDRTRAVSAVLAPASPSPNIASVCTGSAIDCAHAGAQSSIGNVSVGGGLVTVTGLSEKAQAEEGQGALPAVFQRAGTITIGGSAPQTIHLESYQLPAAAGMPGSTSWPVSGSMSQGGATVTFDGSVIVQNPKVTSSPASRPTGDPLKDCKTEACKTTVSGQAGVVINLTVTIQVGGVQMTQFAMVVDLGGVVANASFKAAQNG
jgi:type II secretory pathway pseudopilin PulG